METSNGTAPQRHCVIYLSHGKVRNQGLNNIDIKDSIKRPTVVPMPLASKKYHTVQEGPLSRYGVCHGRHSTNGFCSRQL